MKASFEYKAILLKLKGQIRERGSHEQLMAYGFLRDRPRLQVCDAIKYRPDTYHVQANYEGVLERTALAVAKVIESLGLVPNLVDILDWVKHGDLTSRQIQSPAMAGMRSALLEWKIESSMLHGAGVRWLLAKTSLEKVKYSENETITHGAEQTMHQARWDYNKQEARIAQAQARSLACREEVKSNVPNRDP